MAISAPRNFTGVADSHTAITLTWTLCEAAITRIYRSDAEPFNSFHFVDQIAAGQPSTFTDTGLTPSTEYAYFATALDGGRELPSATIRVTTDNSPSAPTAPSGLTLTAAAINRLDFSFTDNSNNETEFQLRLTDVRTETVYWRGSIAPNSTTTFRGGLPDTTLFRCDIRARNAVGFSAFSPFIYAATTAPLNRRTGGSGTSTETPAIPSAFRVTVEGEAQATFAWSDNSSNEIGFRLVLMNSGGGVIEVFTVAPNTTSLTVTSPLVGGRTYTARLEAFNNDGVGVDEDGNTCVPALLTFTTDTPQRPLPSPPTSLVATEIGPAYVEITFDASATNADTVSIWRDTVPTTGNTEIVSNLLPLQTTYIDHAGLVTSTTYRYTATATNPRGTSAASNSDDVTITAALEEIEAPYGHTLIALDSVTLQAGWAIDGATHETFTLEISATSSTGPWTTVSSTILPNVRAYTITGRTPETQYWTRVTAVNGAVSSAPSNVATATTPDDLIAVSAVGPTITSVRVVSPTSARVFFQSNDATVRSYQGRISSGGAYANNGSAVGPEATYLDLSSLSGSTTYNVQIRATNDGGTGDSAAFSFRTLSNGGSPGLAARFKSERHYRRLFGNADADIDIPTPPTDAIIHFAGQTTDAVDGPFADLYVDAVKVSPAYENGHSTLKEHALAGGETVVIQITGAGSGTSLYRLAVVPQ